MEKTGDKARLIPKLVKEEGAKGLCSTSRRNPDDTSLPVVGDESRLPAHALFHFRPYRSVWNDPELATDLPREAFASHIASDRDLLELLSPSLLTKPQHFDSPPLSTDA
jgi:hypothetical protein